ncbi:crossover junction endodeoxyribonuclease RuvC [Candidatus Vampirococcus lugosii]|uniref:Holliday junction resolvasome RuvABC endonuclease subunit n=1 Tax=Candidatus Vampirococcus lugosii TaxID=2789015 RepID=A0ABS5QMU9_9BACT|nr:crossover junction endodeoxyribonuclease RuvC [Candidatus Vampirococcus lugosii]MBS8122016.1 Holliday junction resolvasome RuvABC endonuclease subunit [Candidatus Vampirococcus lugosii]
MFIGIDPGARKLGYAIIDKNLNIIDAGILLQEKKNPNREDYFQKIFEIQNFFEKIINQYNIQKAGMEKLFFTNKNQANAEFVYGVRAVLYVLLIKKNIKIYELSPIELKKYITGNTKANKITVQNFVMKIFSLEKIPEYDDAADALGLAYISSILK